MKKTLNTLTIVNSPDDSALDELCDRLREKSSSLDQSDAWVGEQLSLCAQYGVFRWFVPQSLGGLGWTSSEVTAGYLKLAQACLTTTFVITQRTGACSRIVSSDNHELQKTLIPPLLDGSIFATVGISHLTTSRQHLQKPAMMVTPTDNGFIFDGFSPWVTGSPAADFIVMGGVTDSDEQIMAVVPTELENVIVSRPPELVALTASQTGQVSCQNVFVDQKYLIAGPLPNVMSSGVGANTGGHQTSTLALGLAKSAIDYVIQQAQSRDDLNKIGGELLSQWETLIDHLMAIARGQPLCSNEELRTSANSLVLRATQASMSAAKGAGYLATHPAGRWCREALFFLVWSCPRSVVDANLCELAGIQ